MEAGAFARVVELMARMAGGDTAALFVLHEEFGAHLASMVRRHLRGLGVHHAPAEDIQSLVTDACFELLSCASGWDPQRGALPWTWAERRIHAAVARFVGIHTDSLDADGAPEPEELPATRGERLDAVVDSDGEAALLRRVAARDRAAALLVEALDQVASPRNQEIVLSVTVQARLGDPSPATTVARDFNMRPEAIRQVCKRAKDGLRGLAAAEPRFADLRDLALLA